jgi:hypothetical protein
MVENMDTILSRCMDAAYPTTFVKVKSTDDPWITLRIRRRIKRKKKIYLKQGRSEKWKEAHREVTKLIRDAKFEFYERKKKIAKEKGSSSQY